MTSPFARLRLQDRIVLFVVALLASVLVVSFLFIRYSIQQTAQETLRAELRVAARVFTRLLEQADRQRIEATSVMTLDSGLRAAIAARDRATLLAALRGHADRIRARGMTIVGVDGTVLADLLSPSAIGQPYGDPELLARARQGGAALGMRMVERRPYRVVMLPVGAPQPIGYVASEFAIDDAVARDLQSLASSDVSFIVTGVDTPGVVATTLTPAAARALQGDVRRLIAEGQEGITIATPAGAVEMVAVPVPNAGRLRIYAVIQRLQSDFLGPYLALQAALLVIAAAALAVTLFGSLRIGRGISRPVAQLVSAARDVSQGNYAVRVPEGAGEMGELAGAFNAMASGLAERDRIRDVLGKVAHSDVVQQLQLQHLQLGGQELDASVMFTDVRNFTAICENLTPPQALAFLNEFLTTINGAIEQYGGVVDKYVGDGVMALFGAPITRHDDAQRAIEAAMAIRDRIAALRPALLARGMPAPEVGIGLNTSRVVAGNVGSPSRLQYTVMGDGVNLASRLEGLTKRYLVPIVVGNRTRESVQGIEFRELDKVRVHGRLVPERIWEPLGRVGSVDPATLALRDAWHAALAKYRARDMKAAKEAMHALFDAPGYQRVVTLYLGYIRQFEASPPDGTWDASFTLYEK